MMVYSACSFEYFNIKYSIVFVLALYFFVSDSGASTPLNPDGHHVCEGHFSYTAYRETTIIVYTTQSYETCTLFSIFGGCALWMKKTKYRMVSKSVVKQVPYQGYRKEARCCHGWSQEGDECPEPVCSDPCIYGECVSPDYCTCNTGYTGKTCTEDINECLVNNGDCDQLCKNNNGAYECSCRAGYRKLDSNTKRCEDIDECTVDLRHDKCFCVDDECTATCTNRVGNYICQCSNGFYTKDNRVCQDLDECNNKNGGCSHTCLNQAGSYECRCPIGYKLEDDQKSCQDIDECSVSNGQCDHACTNNNGSFVCSCRQGYILESNKLTCADRDECVNTDHGCQHCENLSGSYVCTCPDGFQLNNDNKTCSDFDECEVIGVTKEGSNITKAGCTFGCNNTNGSFKCTCPVGWLLLHDGKTCTDYDECLRSTEKLCEEVCVNTIGSYRCICKDGYTLASNKRDCIGEACETIPPLSNGTSTCLNGITNDQCSFQCNQGFKMVGDGTRKCKPNHKWTGQPAECKRRNCVELNPPLNTKLWLSCDTQLGGACQYECDKGLLYIDNDSLMTTCTVNQSSDAMYWTNQGVKCIAPSQCESNSKAPNKQLGKFQPLCDCYKNSFLDPTCKHGVIFVPALIMLKPGFEKTIEINTNMLSSFHIEIQSSDNGLVSTPKNIILNKSASFVLKAYKPGPFRISYTFLNEHERNLLDKTPEGSIVFVETVDKQSYDVPFDSKGILKEGCHTNHYYGSSAVTFKSNMQFISGETRGITQLLFDSKVLIPLSMTGGRMTEDRFVHDSLRSATFHSKGNEVERRDCFNNTDMSTYMTDILTVSSLTLSIESMVNKLTPFWFQLYIKDLDQLSVRTLSEITPLLVKGQDLLSDPTRTDPCAKYVEIQKSSLYFVYRTTHEIHLLFPSKRIELSSSVTKCIVVNLKDGTVSFSTLFTDSTTKALISDQILNPFSTNGQIDAVSFNVGKGQDRMVTYGRKELEFGSSNVLSVHMVLDGYFERIFSDINRIYEDNTVVQLKASHVKASLTLRIPTLGKQQTLTISGTFDHFSMQNVKTSRLVCGQGNLFTGSLNLHNSLTFNNVQFRKNNKIDIFIQEEQNEASMTADSTKLRASLPGIIIKMQQWAKKVESFSITQSSAMLPKLQQELVNLLESTINNLRTLSSNIDSASKLTKDSVTIRKQLIEAQRRFKILDFHSTGINDELNSFNTESSQIIDDLTSYTINFNVKVKTVKYLRISGAGRVCLADDLCFDVGNLTLITGDNVNKCITESGYNYSPVSTDSTIALYRFNQNISFASHFQIDKGSELQLTMPRFADNYNYQLTGKMNLHGSIVKLRITVLSNGRFTAEGIGSFFDDYVTIKTDEAPITSRSPLKFSIILPGSGKLAKDIVVRFLEISAQYLSSLDQRERIIREEYTNANKHFENSKDKLLLENNVLDRIVEHVNNVSKKIENVKQIIEDAKKNVQQSLVASPDGLDDECLSGQNYCSTTCLSSLESEDCRFDYPRFFVRQSCEEINENRQTIVQESKNVVVTNQNVQLQTQLECFNECPALLDTARSLKYLTENINTFGRCYRRCNTVYKPTSNFTTTEKKSFKPAYYNKATIVCSNRLEQDARFFDEDLQCLKARVCAVSVDPNCDMKISNCLNKIKTLASSNPAFESAYEVYRKNKNALDVLQKTSSGLSAILERQTKYVDFLDKNQPDERNYVAHTQKQLDKIREVKILHSNIISNYSNFKIMNISSVLIKERGQDMQQFIPMTIYTNIGPTATILNLKHKGESVNDAALALLQSVIPWKINEKHEESEQQNQVYKKCYEMESSAAFLTSLVIMVKNKIKEYQTNDNTLKDDVSNVKSGNDALLKEIQQQQNKGENTILLHELEQVLHSVVSVQNHWNNTYHRFLTTLKAEMQDDGSCFALFDCINYHFYRILNTISLSKSIDAIEFRENYQELNQTFHYLFNHQFVSVSETKDAANSAYSTILQKDVVSIFCGTKPIIKSPLDRVITLIEGEEMVLSVELANNQLDYTIAWTLNGLYIFSETKNDLQKTVTVEDGGMYSCMITNRFGSTDCGIIKVAVIPKPVIFNQSLNLSTIDVYEKSPKRMQYLLCNATDSSIIQWWHRPFTDQKKTNRIPGGEKWLLMSPEMSRASGYYWCEVRNTEFTVASTKIEFYFHAVLFPTEQIEVSFQLKFGNLKKRRDISRETRYATDYLTPSDLDKLRVALASAMFIQESAIKDLKYTKFEAIINVTFVLVTSNLNSKLGKVSSWDLLTDTIIEERKHILAKLALLDVKIDNRMAVYADIGKMSSVKDSLYMSGSNMRCPDGHGLLENGFICGECSPGTRSLNNKCEACDINKYQPQTGQRECLACPFGHLADEVGSKSASECKLSPDIIPTTTAPITTTIGVSTTMASASTNGAGIVGGNQREEEGSDKILIPSVVAGVIILLIFIIIILVFIIRRRRTRREKQRVAFNTTAHVNPTFHTDTDGNQEGFYPRLPFEHQQSEEKVFNIPEKDLNKTLSQKRLVRENEYDFDEPPFATASSPHPQDEGKNSEKKTLPDTKQKTENVYQVLPGQNEPSKIPQKPPRVPPRNLPKIPPRVDKYAENPIEKQHVDIEKNDNFNARSIPNPYEVIPVNTGNKEEHPPVKQRRSTMQNRSSIPRAQANQYESIDDIANAFSNKAYDENSKDDKADKDQYDHLER